MSSYYLAAVPAPSTAYEAAVKLAHNLAAAGIVGVYVQCIQEGFRVSWNSVDEGQDVDAVALCDGERQDGPVGPVKLPPRPEGVYYEPWDINELDVTAGFYTEQMAQPWFRREVQS